MNPIYEKLEKCYQCVREKTDFVPEVAIILGSGFGQFADEYAESAARVLGATIIVSDTDQVIAACGSAKKDFLDKKVDNELDRIIQSKNRYLNDAKIVVPIISQGDPIGSITILPKEHAALGDTELKIAEVGASFLAKQMES